MGVINNLNSFFGNYKHTFYIEKLSIDEISISKDGADVPDASDILNEFLYNQEEKTIFNTNEGFVFHVSNKCYVINFDDYITTNVNLYPKVTISKNGTGLDIKLFMKHD